MTNPELYTEREQTLIKHFIFERYLERFAHIIGQYFDTITYVDGFSGPWKAKSAKYEDTSFHIALQELRKAQETMREQYGKTLRLRCFFIEKDPVAYEQLKSYVDSVKRPGEDIQTFNGEFETAVDEILKFASAGGQKNFNFIFIDPTGWTGFAMNRIEPLLKLRNLELLINFMTGHISRFVKDPAVDFSQLFGREDFRLKLAQYSGLDLEDAAVELYGAELKQRGKFAYVTPAIVLKPQADRTHFHLIYATRHPKGLEVFKDAETRAVGVMNDARAEAKTRDEEPDQGQLFTAGAVIEKSHFENLKVRYSTRAKSAVIDALKSAPRVLYDRVWEIALCHPFVSERDLKIWIKEWLEAGNLSIDGLKPRERVPKRRSGHGLTWHSS